MLCLQEKLRFKKGNFSPRRGPTLKVQTILNLLPCPTRHRFSSVFLLPPFLSTDSPSLFSFKPSLDFPLPWLPLPPTSTFSHNNSPLFSLFTPSSKTMPSLTAPHGLPLFLLLFLFLFSSVSAQSQPSPDPRSDPYQYRLSGSMAVIIVILIAALFFMAFFSVYIRHCNDSQSNTIRPITVAAGRSRRATRGLDPAVIETFPTLIYSDVKEHKIGKSALECAVCLNEFEDDETLRLIPKCDHVFHPECIDAWLASHSTCPVCRANLSPQLTESVHRVDDSNAVVNSDTDGGDIEAQSTDVVLETTAPPTVQIQTESELTTTTGNKALNRTRTRGSRSNRLRWLFPRSHSTGHSLVQPGEDTERFTLRLPVEIRKQVVNRKLNRAMSMVVLARQSSSMRGYRFGSGEGSSRGKYYRRLERLDRTSKSDRWVLSMTPPFFTRMSSMKTPRGGSNRGEPGSGRELGQGNTAVESSMLPV
uniref:RING-type E3 ubiquitin transferase n=2 Tax=Cucumis sativus TaxID=3659 RepID=A0A0A0LFQ4_CUCSA